MSQDFHVWFDPKKYESKEKRKPVSPPPSTLQFTPISPVNPVQPQPNRPQPNNFVQPDLGFQNNGTHHKSNSQHPTPPNNFGMHPHPPNITSNKQRTNGHTFEPKVFNPIENAQNYIDQTLSSPIASFGFNQAQNLVSNVQENYKRDWFVKLQYYFSVNNYYVLNKLKILLFPYMHRSWARKTIRGEGGDAFLPPNEDINAPDLYIPTMALITYVLVVGALMGFSDNNLNPETLSITATTAILTLALEVFIVKLLFYLFLSDDRSPSIPILDIFAYCGYRFVGIIFILLIGFSHPIAFYGAYAFFTLITAWFMIKTLRQWLPSVPEHEDRKTRNYILVGIVIIQGILTYFLCYTL